MSPKKSSATRPDPLETLRSVLAMIRGLGESAATGIANTYGTVADVALADIGVLVEFEGVDPAMAARIRHAARTAANTDPAVLAAIRHDDDRTLIPTDELSHLIDITGDGEADIIVYDRDLDLDPQLVWRGKDQADLDGLELRLKPIYRQDHIDPRAIIEKLRATSPDPDGEPELTLFDDFDRTAEREDYDDLGFYEHSHGWQNRLILGDSLDVMASLAEKEHLKGQVQTIYFDPPYGIKFQSNWQVSTRKNSVSATDISAQPEQVRAFRDTWRDGVHSYLAYLRDRLVTAHVLLSDSGSIFVQIGDTNLHLVRALMDEVFGSENFVSVITMQKTSGAGSPTGTTTSLATVTDYICWYARDRASMKYRPLYEQRDLAGNADPNYRLVEMPDGTVRSRTDEEKWTGKSNGRFFRGSPLTSQTGVDKTRFPVEVDGVTYRPKKGVWKTGETGMARLKTAGRLLGGGQTLSYKRYFDDFGMKPLTNIWTDTVVSGFSTEDAKSYVVQTTIKAPERCVLMTSDPGDLVLDPTCGSGTTAVAAEKWGRRWITIDTSRVAISLARVRLMGFRYPYWLLADTPEGAQAEAAQLGQEPVEPTEGFRGDVRRGFALRRASRIMLKTIARCDEIVPGMSRKAAEAAIRRAAEFETLYDQPIEDPKRVRVAGPFTVESLSPSRALDATTRAAVGDDGGTDAEPRLDTLGDAENFTEMVLENLSKSAVQNGYVDGRMGFDFLNAVPGEWIAAVGQSTTTEGKPMTVAVTIGPETGTVGRQQVRGAALEAARDFQAQILLVVAYAFDAGATDEASTQTEKDQTFFVEGETKAGKVRVLNVRMNADLMMDDELKATGAGNLFMVFGEPDIEVTETSEGKLVVEVGGVDVYDPNKNEVRSSGIDDIAAWFIDTDYDGQQFFVRHAYFHKGGSNDPYKALKDALKAEIDADAWDQLYRTTSIPFAPPNSGRIAVKAINHYGDEVMKVYQVDGG